MIARICVACAVYALFGGLVSFLGWPLGLRRLTDWYGNGISIQPNAAICSILVGTAVLLMNTRMRRTAAAAGWFAALIAAATLLEHLSGLDLGIDNPLTFGQRWGGFSVVSTGRMGLPGSTSWLLLGVAVALAQAGPRARRAVPTLALIVACISGFSITAYLFGAQPLYSLARITAIAVQTATFIFVLALALVLAVPELDPARTLFARDGAGAMARRTLPLVLVLPLLLGFARIAIQRFNLMDLETATALRTVLEVLLLAALLWRATRMVAAREQELTSATASLRDRELFVSGILSSIRDAFYVVDNDWRVTFANDQMLERLGLSRSQVTGCVVWDLLPSAAGEAASKLRLAMTDRVSVEYETFVPQWQLWIQEKCYPTADGGLAIYSCDVTERKRVSQALERSEELVRRQLVEIESLYAAAPTGLLFFDLNFRFVRVNAALAAMNGVPVADHIGKTPFEIIPGLANDAHAVFQKVVATNAPLRFELTGVTLATGGQTRIWDEHWYPVNNSQGQIIGVGAIVQDVTDRRRAEQALRDADTRKDQFLATLAHELRNPMAPIRSAIQILKDETSSESEKTWAREVIDRQSALMGRLLDDLLDVSRITRDRLELRKETVELVSLVQDVVSDFRPVGGRLTHQIQVDVPAGPIYLHADPVRLAQAVGNLLQNACKFSNPDSRIDLTVSRTTDGEALIVVRDYGLGIPADKLGSIFEMFSQVHSSLERSQGGLGIGLHLVKRLVELHGGTVAVSSPGPGSGSEFTLRLPAMRQDVIHRAPAARQNDQRVQSLLRRILVVDDNRDACRSLSLLLKKVGNETETAYDGEEAVSKTESYQPDVILLDIGLPKMNGYDACRAIRARKLARQPVIVALTGWGQEEDRSRSSAAGFDHHLVKPVDFAVLNKLLADLPSAAPN